MPDGKLTLRVFDAHGGPIREKVDVLLRTQVLSHAPAFRDMRGDHHKGIKEQSPLARGRRRICGLARRPRSPGMCIVRDSASPASFETETAPRADALWASASPSPARTPRPSLYHDKSSTS